MMTLRPAHARLPGFALFCALIGCSGADPWTGSVTLDGGVEVVFSPGIPLLGDAGGAVTELWDIRETAWVDPSRIHVRSGFITVVDPQASQVHVISTSGAVRGSFGQKGGGPGEFLRVLDAFRVGDRLVVLDGGKGSAEYLDLDGRYLSSLHLQGQPWSGFPLDDGALLVKGEFLKDPLAESFGDWVRVSGDGTLSAYVSRPLDPLPEEQGVQCSDLSPWGAGAARLRLTTPHIQVFDPTGRLVRESRIDLPVEVVSDEARRTALSGLRQTMEARGLPPEFMGQSLAVMEQRWRVKCRFGPLRFDASRRYAAFLEQNPDEFGSGNATLHFVSERGVYLARVPFPTPWRDFDMDDGVVYALTRDSSTDVVTLEAFRVALPRDLLRDADSVLDEARRRTASQR